MPPSREIEKLQRRWQENPLGLTFAPLAEAYRKEGMFADALELLGIGLAQHPAYVPAHIVRGRCFLDTKTDSEAERSFVRVTELDPENVIALKGLADIAERAGRYEEAIGRLERLLAFDRANDEAQLQYERLVAHRHIPMTGAVDVRPESVPIAADVTPEVSFAPPVPEPVTPEPAVIESAAESILEPSEMPAAAIVEPAGAAVEIEVFNPVELTAVSGSEYQQPDAAESLAASEPVLVPEPADSIDPAPIRLEVVEVVEAPVFAPADEAPQTGQAPPEPVEVAVDAPAPTAPAEPAPAEPAPAEPAPADSDIEAEPELVVTETMAEVFLRQGHRQLALAVYTQLAGRDPGNPRIQAALEALQEEFRPAASASGLPAFAAVLTGGQSVRGYFEQLLAARRPTSAPTAADLSLGEIFGDDSGRAAALPSAPAADPSYDEFFADATVTGPTSSEPAAPPEAAGEDLEQFTDWLKGLRR